MRPRISALLCAALAAACAGAPAPPQSTTPAKRYFAHPAVEDSHGVIAPWYRGPNGQLDFRVQVAADTLKRYPWATRDRAVATVPEYMLSGAWTIAGDGAIRVPPISDWANGDLGQRAAYVLSALVDHYRYSGDPMAVAHLTLQADALLDHALAPAGHPWAGFLISVPVKGKPYGRADPRGMIQLDITAEVGIALLRAYQLTGRARWWSACKRWADLLAANCRPQPGISPWNRYANPHEVAWDDHQTGGVVFILQFLDDMIDAGYRGRNDALLRARDAGRRYLRDVLLPRWTVNDTWGRNYWDWPDPVQAENVTEFAVRYMMERPRIFANWRNDARNIMALFLQRTSVDPASAGGVYSGAWAFPESAGCCGSSLSYGPQELATVWAQYAALTGDAWAREVARRMAILSTYDALPTGVVEDNIRGGPIVAGDWFKIAHPMAHKHALGVIAWMPDIFAPRRENHIVRTTHVVRRVVYEPGRVAFEVANARSPAVSVLRLAFRPTAVRVDGRVLRARVPGGQGYTSRALHGGDWLVTVRHDGARHIEVTGADPQRQVQESALTRSGGWRVERSPDHSGAGALAASSAGAALEARFTGHQVRVVGCAGPDGGLADVWIDGAKQLAPIDAWCPDRRARHVLFARSGLPSGPHVLRIVTRGAGNPASTGSAIRVDAVQYSNVPTPPEPDGAPGPRAAQRWVFGYAGREDLVDSRGHRWRPALEVVTQLGTMADSVAQAWWHEPRRIAIAGTSDPALYRYGMHAKEIVAIFTVAPGAYGVRLKFAETREAPAHRRAFDIALNGERMVTALDVAATAGGMRRAADLVFRNVRARSGTIEIRLTGVGAGEAMIQAAEVVPGDPGPGLRPVSLAGAASTGGAGGALVNAGFEDGIPGDLGELGKQGGGSGWLYVFAGSSRAYIFPESAYAIHPEWGLPVVRSGKEALRTHTDGSGLTYVYQTAAVRPNTSYRASVWIMAVDLRGRGFGRAPTDRALLRVQELGADERPVAQHLSPAITDAGPYRQVAVRLRTRPETVKVRFLLETHIVAPYDEGHVTYDDAELVEEER